MKRLILVRHGESEWNKLNLFTGWTDVDLTEAGIREAYEAGKLLLAEGYHPEICFTSYLKRAVKTLNEILDAMNMDYLPVQKSWRLNEKSYGALQGQNKKEAAQQYGDDQVLLWRRSFDTRPPALTLDDPRSPRREDRYKEIPDNLLPMTEALKDTIERLMPYYQGTILKAFEKYNEVLVVAHGNSLRGIVKELKQMSNDEIIKFNMPTAVPYVFEFDDRMQVVSDKMIGDAEAIAQKMQSVANQGKAK